MSLQQRILRLILVYNADSGALHALAESARKLFGASGCALCRITHGLVGEKEAWRDCQAALGVPVETLHRDEICGEMKEQVGALPCVVAETTGGFVALLGAPELERCFGRVDEFKARLLHHAAMHHLEGFNSE